MVISSVESPIVGYCGHRAIEMRILIWLDQYMAMELNTTVVLVLR